MKFTDLHCHNHIKSFLWLKSHEKHYRKKDQFHPWTIISPNLRAERKAKGSATSYTQCDLVKLWNGKVRLTFNSLYSLERGFFMTGKEKATGSNRFLREIVRIATSHKLPLRDLLQMFYMRIPDAIVDYFQSPQYDYWEYLQEEYAFAVSKSGVLSTNHIVSPGLLRKIFENRRNRRALYPESLDAKATYQIPRNRGEAQQLLQRDDIITMIMTIEGAHCFGSDTASYAELEKRLMLMKTNRQQWPYPVFFLTLAHHFDNNLCGHANSLPDLGTWFLNQSKRKNGSFTPEGRKFLRKALSLQSNDSPLQSNNTPDPQAGYRMLIDVKHMAARSRKEFYKLVNDRFQQGDVIPVIASHCGYSGQKTLDDLITSEQKEKDDYFIGAFNAWNINVCDEDIMIIFKTKGLFGLSFDQRILGVPKAQKKEGGRNSLEALWDNICAVLDVIYNDSSIPAAQKHEAWNIITIGTDFEGFIDPVNRYNTALDFPTFRSEMIAYVDALRTQPNVPACLKHFTTIAEVEIAIDNLCYNNAATFVERNYPD
jgi:hypothetical protein